MPAEFWEWMLNLVSVTGLIGGVAYLFRNAVARFFSKAVESHFEKQMETFKAEIRDKERELDQIMSFLVSAHRERDSATRTKRLEAAEILLRVCHELSKFSVLVEYMKILKTEELLKNNNEKVTAFISELLNPINIDDTLESLKVIDRTFPKLYLSNDTLKLFEIYQSIMISAVTFMKFFSIPIGDKDKYVKSGVLSKLVSDVLPDTKESFEKLGDGYAYYWSQYFYDEVLRLLRWEVSGSDELSRDAKSIERLAVDSRQAQFNIRASLHQVGLPETLIKSDDSPSASRPVGKGVTP